MGSLRIVSAAALFFFGSLSNSRSVISWWARFDWYVVGLLLVELVGIRAMRFHELPMGFLPLSTWAKSMGGPIFNGPIKSTSNYPGGAGFKFKFRLLL